MYKNEVFEKCLILSNVKSKIPDFEREKRKISTAEIQLVFRGLEFESDPREIGFAFHGALRLVRLRRIGQKEAFFKGLIDSP